MNTLDHAATEHSKLTQVAGELTGTLWCGYHQGYAEAATGQFLLRNNKKRWMCLTCMKKRGIQPQ